MSTYTQDLAHAPAADPAVVGRFADHVELPAAGDLERAFDEHAWDRLAGLHGPLALKRLVTALDPRRIAELQARATALDAGYRPTRLGAYFYVEARAHADLDAIAAELSTWPSIDRAYVHRPGPDPAVSPLDDPRSVDQGYLDPAPAGIDARYAWTVAGGDGAGQRVVDVERGWMFDHEDLAAQNVTLIHGSILDTSRWHGTCVLGEVCAVDNTIGCVGIVPNVASVLASSYHTSTLADAILAAIDRMEFGDVLLLEAQVYANAGSQLLGPVEIGDAEFDLIRLATALGIVVVEPGGNGTGNEQPPPMAMDTWQDDSGRRLLWRDPANPDFRDSGAIVVSAASAAAPRTRLAWAPHGTRIDCHAWGQGIATTMVSATGYTSGFNGTSGSSPMVAGAALAIQGIVQASRGYRLSPREIRALVGDPALNTPAAPGETTQIGVMPNLRKIIEDRLGIVPDVYMRDFVGDAGEPHTGPVSTSPDIIVSAVQVADPQAAFGAGSGTENLMPGTLVAEGQPNYVYARALNQGGAAASNVDVHVYWSQVATLVTPDMWQPIGVASIASVPMGEQLTCSDAVLWPAAAIPGPGHYCFVAVLGTAGDPAPDPGDFEDFWSFVRFVRDNNNVTWCNFQVLGVADDGVSLDFVAPGWPDEVKRMHVEIDAQLPRDARLELEVQPQFLRLAQALSPAVRLDGKTARLAVPASGRHAFADMDFPANERFEMRLHARLPAGDPRARYRVVARQMHGDQELGRVTWMLSPAAKAGA